MTGFSTATAGALALGLALGASASDQAPQPAVSQTAARAAASGIPAAKPDFRTFADGQYIFVMNGGDADWTGPLDVKATCAKEGTKQTATSCGPNFPNGNFFSHLASFPSGHGPSVAPIKGSDNAQQVSGYGWRALRMDLPPGGSYAIVVTVDPQNKVAEKDEANNVSTKAISIAAPAGSTIQVNPGALKLSPTKTP